MSVARKNGVRANYRDTSSAIIRSDPIFAEAR
jgi:hypothetical protein